MYVHAYTPSCSPFRIERLVIRTCGSVYTTASLSNAPEAIFRCILPGRLFSIERDVSQRGSLSINHVRIRKLEMRKSCFLSNSSRTIFFFLLGGRVFESVVDRLRFLKVGN